MAKPLRVVVVGDEHGAALTVGEELEKSGYEPAIFLAPGEAELERLAPTSELVIAWARRACRCRSRACWRSPPSTRTRPCW